MQVLSDAQWGKFEAAIAMVKGTPAQGEAAHYRGHHRAARQRCQMAFDPKAPRG
jgi:hypothetical protein